MSSTNTTSSGGIGFFGLLTILFVALKLTGYIDWSWWWVLAPIWGPMAFGILIILLFIGFSKK
jgi:hypothetical protein